MSFYPKIVLVRYSALKWISGRRKKHEIRQQVLTLNTIKLLSYFTHMIFTIMISATSPKGKV